MLCNKKHYFSPNTIEDDKNSFNTTKIKFDGVEQYFKDCLSQKFRKLIDIIYDDSIVAEYFCYDTIYKSVLSLLEEAINSENIGLSLTLISCSLNKKLAKREFYFILNGLKLKNINELVLTDVSIFNFGETHLAKIIENQNTTSKNNDCDKQISECIKKNFLGETCIKISCFGDSKMAEQRARLNARLVLNYFRFLFCVVWYERIHENSIKISMKSEVFRQGEVFFYQSEPKGIVTYSSGTGRRNLQDFELDEHFIKECKEDIFLNEFIGFAFKKDKTKIENIITTAIYWIGEAQADFDKESSFLKYWIALESIITPKKENQQITQALCKGIATILAFIPYRFIEIHNIDETYKRVSTLYALRGNIVHRGNYQEIKETELIEMCKLSWQTVLSLFYVRSINYTQIAQVQEETNRLYRNLEK